MAKYVGENRLADILGWLKSWASGAFAAISHQHSATDISSGTLPVSVGGTGQSDLANVTVGNANKVSNHTVGTDVPSNAVFTDTTYSAATTSANGLMSSTDKAKLDSGGMVVVSSTAPSNTGALWVDTSSNGVAKYHNGTSWVNLKAVWG